MSEPRPIPWSQIRHWSCVACGECCKWFSIPLTTYEYAKISQRYGFNITELWEGRAWLKKRMDKRCVFMIWRNERWLCGLQESKPHACRMWPFKVFDRPTYGKEMRARYESEEWTGYVYADPRCPRLIYGVPTQNFERTIVREFVQMAHRKREHQDFSTASLPIASVAMCQSHVNLLLNPDACRIIGAGY